MTRINRCSYSFVSIITNEWQMILIYILNSYVRMNQSWHESTDTYSIRVNYYERILLAPVCLTKLFLALLFSLCRWFTMFLRKLNYSCLRFWYSRWGLLGIYFTFLAIWSSRTLLLRIVYNCRIFILGFRPSKYTQK